MEIIDKVPGRSVDDEAWSKALKGVRKVISHANCPDGAVSALLAKLAFGDSAEYALITYGSPEHKSLKAEPGLLFCDFTPPRERVQEFVAMDSIVLDHHKGAEDLIRQFKYHSFADEKRHPGVSGAVLTLHHVLLQQWAVAAAAAGELQPLVGKLHKLAEAIGIRDTWKKDVGAETWREACQISAIVSFVGWRELSNFDLLSSEWLDLVMNKTIGAIMHNRNLHTARSAIENSFYWVSKKGTRVRIINNYLATSDAADFAVGKYESDLVVGFNVFYEESAGPRYAPPVSNIAYTLRTRCGYDCAALAKAKGGGGHTQAAGFKVESSADPYTTFIRIIDEVEATY